MNGAKRQVSFRVDEETAKAMEAAAANDGIKELGPFCRLLVEWAFGHYQKVQSWSLLKECEVHYARLEAANKKRGPR